MGYRALITVTEKHIREAVPESSAKCMVAEAVIDAFPGSTRPHVDMQTIRYTDGQGIRRTYLTPASVQAALVRFDAGDPVSPFAFKLPSVMHISKPTRQSTSAETRHRLETKREGGSVARPRIGGHGVPIMGNATRRRFGIRNLRINAEGKVEQLGVVAD